MATLLVIVRLNLLGPVTNFWGCCFETLGSQYDVFKREKNWVCSKLGPGKKCYISFCRIPVSGPKTSKKRQIFDVNRSCSWWMLKSKLGADNSGLESNIVFCLMRNFAARYFGRFDGFTSIKKLQIFGFYFGKENHPKLCLLLLSSWWDKLKILLSLGYDVVKWWTIPSESLEHCLHGAKIFHKAVDGFGASHFGRHKASNKHCLKTCAVLTGNPKNRVD